MNLNEFFDYIDKRKQHPGDIIVQLEYKYEFEDIYHISNEILSPINDCTDWEWLNDWYEGYDDVRVIGWIPVSDAKVWNLEEEEHNEI